MIPKGDDSNQLDLNAAERCFRTFRERNEISTPFGVFARQDDASPSIVVEK